MSKNKPATVNGQPLSYWAARCDDKNRQVRDAARAAMEAFRRLPRKKMVAFVDDVPALCELFWRKGSRTAWNAWYCLKMMGQLVLPSLPHFLEMCRNKRGFYPELAAALLGLAQNGRRAALTMLLDYLRNVRHNYSALACVANSVEHLGTDAASVIPILETKFGRINDPWTDRAIAGALGRAGIGAKTLIRGLAHKEAEVRGDAARSLGQVGAPEAVQPLVQALADDDYQVAAAAAESLGRLGEAASSAVGPLTDATKSKSKNLRAAAVAALKRLPAATPEEEAAWRAERARRTASQTFRTSEDILRTILDNPDDVAARLVYADWLDEHDNPRGEFIRVQCRLAELPEEDAEREDLVVRERELWAAHGKEWRKEVPAWPNIVRFRRGFAEAVQCPARAFLKQGAGLFRRSPVIWLILTRAEDHLAALADCRLLLHVRSLDMGRFSEKLAASTHLVNLTCLNVECAGINDAVCEAIAASPHLARLTQLRLNGNNISDRGVIALARSPHMSNLNTLILGANPFGLRGLRSLAESPHMANLHELALWGCEIGPEGAEALAASKHLTNLRKLNLIRNPLGDRGVMALIHSRQLAGLKQLWLDVAELSAETKTAITTHFGPIT
jgi:uncharacterized protein (TIGR02996 family)